MKIVPTIISKSKVQFRFINEVLKFDGEEIYCLSLFKVDDSEIRIYLDKGKFGAEETLSDKQAEDCIAFLYEGGTMPEDALSPAHIKAIKDAARIYMETSREEE